MEAWSAAGPHYDDQVRGASTNPPAGNLAGSRRPVEVPEFGARELVQEIDSAQKFARELDRQLRGYRGRVRTDAVWDGSIGRDSSIMSQAAVGDEILDLTNGVGERMSLRSGASFFSVSNDSTLLTHSHTRLVNVAVIDRQSLSFSEQGVHKEDDDATQFQVHEATIMPQRTGMSLLMFDLCCAQPRIRRDQKKAYPGVRAGARPNRCATESGISMLQKIRRSRGSEWDPETDAHLTTGKGQVAQRAVEPSSLRTGGWT
mmetsp:Transcript_18197/g.44691  ORF Transcript_18197/g.44691 Transcript_18197/m.44691 type:complete len:259 (+) Transcript_18197:55-831(+)